MLTGAYSSRTNTNPRPDDRFEREGNAPDFRHCPWCCLQDSEQQRRECDQERGGADTPSARLQQLRAWCCGSGRGVLWRQPLCILRLKRARFDAQRLRPGTREEEP